MGLDIGERRVGIAISDASQTVASALDVLDAGVVAEGRALTRLIEEWDVGLLVVGLPLSLDGTEGPQASRVREFVSRLVHTIDTPVEYYDERLSTSSARAAMREAGVSERKQRGSVDKVAAALMLQAYLDARGSSGEVRD